MYSEFRPRTSGKIFTTCTSEGGTLASLDENDNLSITSYSPVRICCKVVRRLFATSSIFLVMIRRAHIVLSAPASPGGANIAFAPMATSHVDGVPGRFDTRMRR